MNCCQLAIFMKGKPKRANIMAYDLIINKGKVDNGFKVCFAKNSLYLRWKPQVRFRNDVTYTCFNELQHNSST